MRIFTSEVIPAWPPTDQHPSCSRYFLCGNEIFPEADWHARGEPAFRRVIDADSAPTLADLLPHGVESV